MLQREVLLNGAMDEGRARDGAWRRHLFDRSDSVQQALFPCICVHLLPTVRGKHQEENT